MATRPQQPPLDRWFSSERTLGVAASVLVVAVTLTTWATAWSDWYSYQTVVRYGDDHDQLAEAAIVSGLLGIVAGVVLFASAAVFIVWLWRVRWNAEMFCRGEHRFTRGWVLGSWICPVVNLWYPKQVVDDIVAASDPRTPPRTESLRDVPGTRLVWVWWITWVVGLVTGNIVQRGVLGGATEAHDLRTNVILSTISAIFTTAAAVLAVQLIARIDELQTNRPWVPWWAAGERESGFQPPAR
ncbi:DUF4328 domain-containing protein [Kribbella sandramycini]|uniref:DUF4328 domain-containing protein n=1 Tax=Kribbella sandramycini TaxID=60450 RepID=A0A7Y4NZB4_9ACTN|nr:DUF4328 domain-containing protein [Kribbella sandramycini]MBB6565588.1 hypothetical protein [Kribbella sandramycini]NOL41852.1 DUF4328 domain-containing protein [Kribbella sandramycini]